MNKIVTNRGLEKNKVKLILNQLQMIYCIKLTAEFVGLITRLRLFRNSHNLRFVGTSSSEVGDIGEAGGGALRHNSSCLRGRVRIDVHKFLVKDKKIDHNE